MRPLEAQKFEHNKATKNVCRRLREVAKTELGCLRNMQAALENRGLPSTTNEDDDAYLKLETLIAMLEWSLDDGFKDANHPKRPVALVREFMSKRLLYITEPENMTQTFMRRTSNGRIMRGVKTDVKQQG